MELYYIGLGNVEGHLLNVKYVNVRPFQRWWSGKFMDNLYKVGNEVGYRRME